MGKNIDLSIYFNWNRQEILFENYKYGSNKHSRIHFMSSFKIMFNKLNKDKWDFDIKDLSDDTIKYYIRQLMNEEERVLLENSQ